MSTLSTLIEQMRQHPEDRHLRRVTADAVEEQGHPDVAARMRWAQDAVESGPRPFNVPQDALPKWANRFAAVHKIRKILAGSPEEHIPHLQKALHDAELHSYGLTTPEQVGGHLREYANSQLHSYDNGLLHVPPPLSAAIHETLRPNEGPVAANHHLAVFYALEPREGHVPHADDWWEYLSNNPEAAWWHAANPAPKTVVNRPVHLSRVGDLIRGLLGKRKPDAPPLRHGAGDGIVHTTRTNPEGANVERQAVHQALRQLSTAHHEHTADYVRRVAQIVKDNPGQPLTSAYTQAALHATSPSELVPHVKPLVAAAHVRWRQEQPSHPAFTLPGRERDRLTPTPQPTPEPQPTPIPAEWTLSPLEQAMAHNPFDPPDPQPKKRLTKAELEQRHREVIDAYLGGEGHKGGVEAALQILKAKYGYTHRRHAADALKSAWNVHEIRGKRIPPGPQKLAAYPGSGPIGPTHVTGSERGRGAYHQQIDGTALAYHLREIQRDHPELAEHALNALTGKAIPGKALAQPRVSPMIISPGSIENASQANDDPFVAIGKRLEAKGHRLAKAHDWQNMQTHLARDKVIQDLVREHVRYRPTTPHTNEAEHDAAFWSGVVARAGGKTLGSGADELKRRLLRDVRAMNPSEFTRLFSAVDDKLTHKTASDSVLWDLIQDSMNRTHLRANERLLLEGAHGKPAIAGWRRHNEQASTIRGGPYGA